MNQIDESSPRNVHKYAFTNEIREAILSDDIGRYKFNLYQWYQLDTTYKFIIGILKIIYNEKNKKDFVF